MFENDHSAARGKMAVRELIVFKHDCELGCAPAYKLFDAVKVTRNEGVTAAPRLSATTPSPLTRRPARRRHLPAHELIWPIGRRNFCCCPAFSTSPSAAASGRSSIWSSSGPENWRTTDGALHA